MNSTLQIKESLIARIKESNDVEFLKSLYALFEKPEQEEFELTAAQKQAIEKGRKDIQNGQYKTHTQVVQETKEWLKSQ